jgi:general secretion pathway protein D
VPPGVLSFLSVAPEGEKLLKSGIISDVTVAIDMSTNSLIITAPQQAIPLLAALIERLDSLPSSEAQIKVFTMVNGDASALRELLEELFLQRLNQGHAAGAGVRFPEEGPVAPVRFAVDQRSNSIIVTGSAADLNVIYALVLRLDGVDIRQRKNLVYRLRYTNAPEVALAVQDFLRSEQLRTQQQIQSFTRNAQGALSPFEQIEREVVVVPEALSNTLIISSTPRFYDQILEVIMDIDAIPPMVMVQVLIAEVAVNRDAELGIELGLQDSLLFDRGSVLGGVIKQASITTGKNVAGQELTSFALGRTNFRLAFGGLVLSAGSESVNILIRALERLGRVQILSRPQILTLDNQRAGVQVGADVRIPSGTEVTLNGLINLNTVPVSVGLILEILPRISPDDTVTMLVRAERSRLGPENEETAIAVDDSGTVVRTPQVELARAETVVSVRSGQTAVFSGLLTSNTATLSRRVPLLADIPLLGPLFRFDSTTDEESELLIIMTPHVVRSPDDVDRITQIETSRMNWCLADVVKLNGDPGLVGDYGQWHESEITTVYPDGQPILSSPTDTTFPMPVESLLPDDEER